MQNILVFHAVPNSFTLKINDIGEVGGENIGISSLLDEQSSDPNIKNKVEFYKKLNKITIIVTLKTLAYTLLLLYFANTSILCVLCVIDASTSLTHLIDKVIHPLGVIHWIKEENCYTSLADKLYSYYYYLFALWELCVVGGMIEFYIKNILHKNSSFF